MTTLWIDDERELPSFYDHRESTVEGALRFLRDCKDRGEVLDIISFDYDAHRSLPWTFKEVAYWLVASDYWPKEIRIHTFNHWIGRPWYEKFFRSHAPETTHINPIEPWAYYKGGAMPVSGVDPDWLVKFAEEVKIQP